MRKIYLEGQLGQKFGTSHLFCGDTPAEAFRLIAANYPQFRKYLIDCHEKDIGFHIEVNNQEIDTVECLLPLSQGDIVITPVPAGSKSGGGKILTAIAIAAFVIINPGGLLTSVTTTGTAGLGSGSTMAVSATTGLNTAGLLLSAVSVNLALTGLMQLMAPDPATDQENEEGYLFTGDTRNVVSGDPVPLLYGELRVPGLLVSSEVAQNTIATDNYANTYTGTDNDMYSESEDADSMIFQAKFNSDTQSLNTNLVTEPLDGSVIGAKNQNVLLTHVISEGPIYGLVNGTSSVYLNSDPAQDPSDSNSTRSVQLTFTNGSSSTSTNDNLKENENNSKDDDTKKYIELEDYLVGVGNVAIEFDFNTGTNTSVTLISTSISKGTTFEAFMELDPNTPYNSRVTYKDTDGEVLFKDARIIEVINGTYAKLEYVPMMVSLGSGYTGGSFEVSKWEQGGDGLGAGGGPNLNNTFNGNSNTYNCKFSNAFHNDMNAGNNLFSAAKYKNFGVQFRTGHLYQHPLVGINGAADAGNTSITTGLSNDIGGPGNTSTTDQYTYNTTQLGLTATQAVEADTIDFKIAYGALINTSPEGDEKPGKAWYKIEVRFTNDGTNFTDWKVVREESAHVATSSSSVIFNEPINLELYKPKGAIDWEVRITRLSDNDKAYENLLADGYNDDYTGQSPATISTATTVIKEYLSYPLTAVARTQFNSVNFSGLPQIDYHCKGIKVLVPSNYVTRDEASDGVAVYTRNTSTGTITSNYVNWDGNFRSEKVYTNNPAWIFYDILTNNRYGLGSYLSESDIDKYTLYRIARYCDELIDDGNGGLEPRFTANIWLRKSTDAYKVLKDFSTIFRGIIYWIDGQVVEVLDQASDAVYNFSSSNVVDGQFSYESTGSKTRVNQVSVTWNNPNADYKPEVLLVEDGQNIAKTGKIITQNATAFGATSEGQALRYGRWKLWTAKNQTEIVNFVTSINAAFLRPGDVVNIQDPYRHPPYQTLSGRISSTGTLTSSTIPLDREITLQADSTYELNVLIEEPGAFLSQESATIDSTLYRLGELILTDRAGNPITSEIDASNLLDDSLEPVEVVWKKYTRVETQTVNTSAGSGITSLSVDTAFSAVPNSQTVWALRRVLTASEVEVLGTKEEYKILGITENENNTYNITAVKHYNEKFTAIESNWTLAIDDPVYPAEKADDIVPACPNFYIVNNRELSKGNERSITFQWDAPLNLDQTEYKNIASFEIEHPFRESSLPNPLIIDGDSKSSGAHIVTAYSSNNSSGQGYSASIVTVSKSGKRSKPRKAFISFQDNYLANVERWKGVPRGGVSTTPISINSSNEFQFDDSNYTFTPIGSPSVEVEGSSSVASTYKQDISNIPAIADATWSSYSLNEKLLNAHYIFIDSSDTTDPIKLIKWYYDSTLELGYFYDTGTGNGSNTYWGTASGSISIPKDSNKVTGTSTAFKTDFNTGEYIRIGTNEVAKISHISSDTIMFLSKSVTTAFTNVTGYYTTFRIDLNNDAIIAGIRNLTTAGFKLTPAPTLSFITPKRELKGITQTEGYVYYNTSQSSAPSGPGSSATYTWATGSITGMNSGWQESPPQMGASGNGQFWYARYVVSQSTAEDLTSTITFGSVSAGHNFDGLVTFSGAQLTDGVSSFDPASKVTNGGTIYDINSYGSSSGTSVTTTIDGDFIRTGTVELSRLVSSTFSDATHSFALANTGVSIDGTSFDTTALFTSSDTGGTCVATLGIFDVTASYGFGLAGLSRSTSGGAGGVFCYDPSGSWGANNADSTIQIADASYLLQGWSNGTKRMDISNAGDARFDGNVTAYASFSDIRLKDNIEVIPNALEKVSQLRGVTFDYKADGKRNTGLIAQELEKVLPEVVYETNLIEDEDNKVLAVRYGNVVGLLVEAIKELKAEIEELKDASSK